MHTGSLGACCHRRINLCTSQTCLTEAVLPFTEPKRADESIASESGEVSFDVQVEEGMVGDDSEESNDEDE